MKHLTQYVKSSILALIIGLTFGVRAENVAEVTIGSTTTQYSDLGTAWSACSGQNATLKLLKDVDITSVLNKSWTTDLSLDLGGHTLKQTGNNRIIQVLGKMTVSNGVLTRSGSAYSGNGAGIYVCYSDDVDISKFVMRGVTMTNCVTTSDGGAIYAAKNTQVMLENCTLRQNGAGGNGGAICTEGGATADGAPAKDPSDKLVLISTVITDNTAGVSGAGVYYKYTVKGNSCFAAGTKVLMADGSEKVIEEVEEGDIVRTFDHEGGTNSTARVFMTVKEATTTQIFVLTFADGYGVRCVLSHDFLMKDGDACKYVCLSRENAADYVGKSFYAADGKWHELLSVTDGETVDEVYEIYSAQHLNSYADGLLTVPADVAHVLNIYKLGADLKADAEALAVDIAAYGLAEFAEISSKYGVSREYYDAFGVKYGHVIVGKGLMTLAQMEALCRSTQEEVVSVPPKKTMLKLTTSSNEDDPLKDYPTCNLTLGTGTIVTNNLVGTTPNNIYLEKAGNFYSLIALANDRAGICAGVTPQWTTGQITAFYYANPGDIALFKSDNADYAVWYALGDDGSFLKLAAGSQVVPPTVANTTYEIWKGDEIIAWNEGTTVEKDSNVKVIYTADDGYVFDSSSATTKEVAVNTSTSVATMTPPDTPFEPAASVMASGVTTVYGTLTSAWAEAVKNAGSGATLTMLKDATVESTLTTTGSSGTLTLDLNDHVLAYAGQSGSLITQDGGTLHVVDTATTRSPHYFTCDETGLWTLTNEVTELSVKGGLLTGARNSAIYYFGGAHSVSNVNFVGNASTFNGGALTTYNAFVELTITDCTFLGNVAAENGGAVSCGNVTMTDCWVEKNVATKTGGGVYVRDHGSLVRTKVVGNKVVGEDSVGGGVYVTFSPGGCFPAGVKILMADGTEKAVEEIAEGDAVATFDHEGGVKASAAVFYVYKGTDAQDVFTLSFASGATLDIADRHDLLLEATRKYVTVAYDNARSFIGSRFYNYVTGDWDTLTGVESTQGGSAYYSLYTRGHINCVANGILTLADDVDFYLNVYELDENLKADAEILAADIATYGLATPEEYPNIPLDDFMDSNMRYARIAIAKGLTTQAEIRYWNEFDYGPIVAKKAKGALKLTTSSIEAVSPTAVYLRVGEGTVITGNVNTAGADNAYLDKSNNAVIDILSGTTDLDIGVTLSSGAGVFGWTNDVNYASSFTSDNPDYEVVYTADKTLELISFVEVIPSEVEHTTAEVYDGETKLTEMPYLVFSNAAPVTVVHVAENGYYFADGTTAKTNTVDTSKNPATAEAPDAPFVPVASVTTNGVTMLYADINVAWTDTVMPYTATLKLLADIKLTRVLSALSPTFDYRNVTFDLNDHVLSPADGMSESLISFSSVDGSFKLIDTATTKTKKYFTETTGGLWALTNETTELFVDGGVVTGGKSGRAVDVGNGAAVVIRDVSFVGNSSSGDCGALYADSDDINIYSTRFYGNRAASNGGAICAMNDGRMLLDNCDIRHNVAGAKGGGISMKNKCVLLNTTISDNTAAKAGAGVYFEKKVGCLAAGTMILMADGTEKAIEEIAKDDVVATFDHEGGTNSTARIFLVYESPSKARPFTLAFDNNLALSVVDLHDLLEEASRKYVRITAANASSFIGKRFYGRDGAWHTLTGVTLGTDSVAYYSVYSAQYMNTYANGLLTVPDDVDHLPNIYELDANLKANLVQLAADIETFGLVDPEYMGTKYGADRQYFDDGNLKYLYISVGKGLATIDRLVSDFEAISGGSEATPVLMSVPKMTSGLLFATASEPTLEDFKDYGDGILVLGVNAVVTNNFVGAITNSNIHLANTSSLIALAEDRVGVQAGVELASGTGKFTTTNNVSVADVALFTSDNSAYTVMFVGDHLELTMPDVTFTPVPVDYTMTSVYTNNAPVAMTGDAYLIPSNMVAEVVYTAESGYVFADGSTVKTNAVDTTTNPATAEAPDAPQPAVCVNLTTGCFYMSISNAVATVKENETIRVLMDTIEAGPIVYTDATPAFTLDIDGHTVVGVIKLASGKKVEATNFGENTLFAIDPVVKPGAGESTAVTTENPADVLTHFRSYDGDYYAKNLEDNVVAIAKLGDDEGPIVKKEDGGEIEVQIPNEWRKEYKVPGDEIMRPNLPTENGMPAWQNYALGLDPTNLYSGIYADAAQNMKTDIVTIVTKNLDVQKLADGFGVTYRLDTKLRGASEYSQGEKQDKPSFDVKIDEADPTGVYQLNAIITSNGVEIAQSAKSVNVVGLIRQTQVVTNAIVSVPWGKLVPGYDNEIAVSNVVKTATLTEGDELRVYRPGKTTYECWVLSANKIWEPAISVTKNGASKDGVPESATIPRGSGIWLCRKSNTDKPYYLYGQANGDENEVELKAGSNLIGATGLVDYDLNEHITNATEGDRITVPGENMVPIIYEFKDGKWGYWTSVVTGEVTDRYGNTMTSYQTIWKEVDAKVKPGTGFWLHNNSGKIKVK